MRLQVAQASSLFGDVFKTLLGRKRNGGLGLQKNEKDEYKRQLYGIWRPVKISGTESVFLFQVQPKRLHNSRYVMSLDWHSFSAGFYGAGALTVDATKANKASIKARIEASAARVVLSSTVRSRRYNLRLPLGNKQIFVMCARPNLFCHFRVY